MNISEIIEGIELAEKLITDIQASGLVKTLPTISEIGSVIKAIVTAINSVKATGTTNATTT